MKRIQIAVLLPVLLISTFAFADQTSIKAQTQGEVTFVSGGVGVDEQQAMKAMKSEYQLEPVIFRKGHGRIY